MHETVERKLDHFEKEIEGIESLVRKSVQKIAQAKLEYYWLAHEAEWHLNGLTYHVRRICQLYNEIAVKITERAMIAERPGVLIFYSPEMQALLFEFYALVTLSRITLDHITQHTLAPLFKPGALPGSVNDFLKGSSDIKLHESLKEESSTRYLIDVRDCMVHHRTFATSDNTVAIADHMNEDAIAGIKENWKYPITRTYFRLANEHKLVVNILLPDAFYEYDQAGNRGRLIKDFSYSERRNILRYSMDFIHICGAATIQVLELLEKEKLPQYKCIKRSSGRRPS